VEVAKYIEIRIGLTQCRPAFRPLLSRVFEVSAVGAKRLWGCTRGRRVAVVPAQLHDLVVEAGQYNGPGPLLSC